MLSKKTFAQKKNQKRVRTMIYVTGDIHGEIRLVAEIIEKYGITANDTLILLGDVGVNYYGKHGDRQRKKKLNRLGIPALCIHGNHEMRPFTIPIDHEEVWNGDYLLGVYDETRMLVIRVQPNDIL